MRHHGRPKTAVKEAVAPETEGEIEERGVPQPPTFAPLAPVAPRGTGGTRPVLVDETPQVTTRLIAREPTPPEGFPRQRRVVVVARPAAVVLGAPLLQGAPDNGVATGLPSPPPLTPVARLPASAVTTSLP